jgi:hypothetical protein
VPIRNAATSQPRSNLRRARLYHPAVATTQTRSIPVPATHHDKSVLPNTAPATCPTRARHYSPSHAAMTSRAHAAHDRSRLPDMTGLADSCHFSPARSDYPVRTTPYRVGNAPTCQDLPRRANATHGHAVRLALSWPSLTSTGLRTPSDVTHLAPPSHTCYAATGQPVSVRLLANARQVYPNRQTGSTPAVTALPTPRRPIKPTRTFTCPRTPRRLVNPEPCWPTLSGPTLIRRQAKAGQLRYQPMRPPVPTQRNAGCANPVRAPPTCRTYPGRATAYHSD